MTRNILLLAAAAALTVTANAQQLRGRQLVGAEEIKEDANFWGRAAADKAKNGKKVNNANDRKKGAIPRLNNKAAGAVDDKVLAEDEGYWERFLQDADSSITPPPTAPAPARTPAPTPTPGTCDFEVTTECKITMPDGDTIDCNDLPLDADCGPKSIEYCYTITNEGDECGDINAILRTRTLPGTTEEFSDLFAPEDRNLCPGDEVVICEVDTVDTCNAVCYVTEIDVDATTTPNGLECNSEDEYEFCVPRA